MPLQKEHATSAPADVRRALVLRVISSIILIPIVIAAVYFGGVVFAALIAALTLVMLFEWCRMVERRPLSASFYILAGASALAMVAASQSHYSIAFAIAALSGFVVYFCSRKRGDHWPALGAFYIIVPSIALSWLRLDAPGGLAFATLLFLVVWSADIGAFVFGKLIGGPKISHALSPSKTWAGIGGGIGGGIAAGAIAAPYLFGDGAVLAGILLGGGLGASSVIGDLVESAIKRNFGVKDISSFIPGHGGVLDRLDGMIFATSAMTSVYFVYMMM